MNPETEKQFNQDQINTNTLNQPPIITSQPQQTINMANPTVLGKGIMSRLDPKQKKFMKLFGILLGIILALLVISVVLGALKGIKRPAPKASPTATPAPTFNLM